MPLTILLADDSVPAQNMGKKILIDAGYEVLTVSNGLEALRKIAQTIPDIAILDIFMPGYTGLEICERLRANAATAKLPVILTVGKLEPYRPQDGEHVHSNAVIVKPFAAAELISAVRSLIGAPRAPEAKLEFSGEGRAADISSDPLQEVSFADDLQEIPAEPLFSYNPSAAYEDAALASQDRSVYAAEPVLSDLDLDGPESLVFNPNAKPIPFSASVIDLLPSAAPSSAGIGASAFSEFDLQPGAPEYALASAFGTSAVESEELSFSASAAAGSVGFVADTELAVSHPGPLWSSSAIATEIVASDSVSSLELESSNLNVPDLDPLLELQEPASPADLTRLNTLDISEDVGEPSQGEVVALMNAAGAESASNFSVAAQPTHEEEARTIAFEALFNSTEPFPVEDSSVASEETSFATLPKLPDLSQDYTGDVVPDPEIEHRREDIQPESITAELAAYLIPEEPVKEYSPVSESSNPCDGELLLEEALVTELGPYGEPKAAGFRVEAHSVVPETLGSAPAAVIMQEACAAVPAEVGLQQTDVEVMLFAAQPAPPELAPSESELRLAEPAPAHIEQETAPEPSSPELAEPQLMTHAAEISLSPQPPPRSDADRVHRAVDRVFDRFKHLLVAAIMRELARQDH